MIALFVLAGALLAYWYPVTALIVVAVLTEHVLLETRMAMRICQIPSCERPCLNHLRVCNTHHNSQPSGMRPKALHETHACPVPGCQQRTGYNKLMCYEHWVMVPATQRRAVYASWNGGQPLPDHPRRCADAIDAVKGVIARKDQ